GDGVGRDHDAGAVQVPDRRSKPGRHDRRGPAPDWPPAALPAEVREAWRLSPTRDLPGTRLGVRSARRSRDGRPVKRIVAIAAASLSVLAATASSAGASAGGLRVVEVKGPAFPVRSYVLTLPQGRKL